MLGSSASDRFKKVYSLHTVRIILRDFIQGVKIFERIKDQSECIEIYVR